MNRKYAPYIIILGAMIIINLIDGEFHNFGGWIYKQLLMIPGIVVGLSFHEFAHGFVSYKLGDPTPKLQGRLTVNPGAHIDPIGFFCLFVAGFGWGIPVQIDPGYYKHKRRDEFLVAIAGVTMNLVIAVVFALALRLVVHSNSQFFVSQLGEIIIHVLQYGVFINLVLMVFNLIPVPPLDGFGIITQIFDLEKYSWYDVVYQNGIFILMGLILFNVIGTILNPCVSFLWTAISKLLIY
ncbi:MAG: site-2 protease family protein [Hornefia sp.]|nr:site-2 protease family protein [Hornefia sp.]